MILVVAAQSLYCESLWDPESQGLFSGSNTVQIGDTVLVSIDSETSLSYSATRIDNERVTLELSGGAAGGLFDFLPAGSASGNQSLKGTEELDITASFAVRVVSIDDAGHAIIQGGRTIILQGKLETISLSGVVDPMIIGASQAVPLSRIADARISYTTFLDPGAPTLLAEDLVDISTVAAEPVEAPVGAPVEAPVEAPVGAPVEAPVEGEAATAGGATGGEITQLTDERMRELLLFYINRMIDLVFQ